MPTQADDPAERFVVRLPRRRAGASIGETVVSAFQTSPDPLADALARKAATGAAGGATETPLAAGDGWRVVDVVCTAGPHDRPFEERRHASSVSLVLAGTFLYRRGRAPALLSPGSLLLVNGGRAFECSHEHGEGDRCLSFQFEPELFAQLAHDAGASADGFVLDRLPPLRALAAISMRARRAVERGDALEEVALELAGSALGHAGEARRTGGTPPPDSAARVARVVRAVEAQVEAPHTLADMARAAGLSRYHFLRTFTAVTGVTPHQWVLRARLRRAALRLATTRTPVTEVALDVGFDDLSNFIRTFRAEFGVSPSRYRALA